MLKFVFIFLLHMNFVYLYLKAQFFIKKMNTHFSSLIDLHFTHIYCPHKAGTETNAVSAVLLVIFCYLFGILF